MLCSDPGLAAKVLPEAPVASRDTYVAPDPMLHVHMKEMKWPSAYSSCHIPIYTCHAWGMSIQATELQSQLCLASSTRRLAIPNLFAKVAKSAHVGCMIVCRTPQGIRALARFYVVVFVPLFLGPYYADVRVGARSFAFSLFLAIFVSLLPLSTCQAAADIRSDSDLDLEERKKKKRKITPLGVIMGASRPRGSPSDLYLDLSDCCSVKPGLVSDCWHML